MAYTLEGALLVGDHASRPAFNASGLGVGALYSCTDHDLIYQTDGSAWSTWADLSGSGTADHNHDGSGGSGGDLDAPVIDGYAIFNEEAAPSTPSSGTVAIYAKSDGRIYSKDDTGTEYGPFDAAGGGAGGSDYIATISADTDIVQYWPCNEAAGSTSFNDVIGGTDLTGTTGIGSGGPPLQQDYGNGGSVGIVGNALVLTRTAITWPAAWTIEAWVFVNANVTDCCILGQWNGAGAMIYAADSDTWRIYSGGTNTGWDASPITQQRGLHHIAMTHDGTTQKLIVDGVQRASQTVGAPTTTAGGEFAAGRYSGGTGGAMQYLISDIAIYDAAKSVADLLAHYELGMGL